MFNFIDLWPKLSILAIFTILCISAALFGREVAVGHWRGWRNIVSILCVVLSLVCVAGAVVLAIGGLFSPAIWTAVGVTVLFCILVLYRMSLDDDEVLW